MPIPNRKLRVFLCHASQDKSIVRELYQRLLVEGWIDPWLDEEKLLPGQDWDFEIEKAVEAADVIIVFLSSKAVTKEGYVQKEVKLALNIALYKPEETIFIIPLRLDDCSLPRNLRSFHYLDYFPSEREEWAYKRLVKSMRSRHKQVLVDEAEWINKRESNGDARGQNDENAKKDAEDQVDGMKLIRKRESEYHKESKDSLKYEVKDELNEKANTSTPVPDWLLSLNTQQNIQTPTAIPDWLSGLDTQQGTEKPTANPNWFLESNNEQNSETPTPIPDWLSGLNTEQDTQKQITTPNWFSNYDTDELELIDAEGESAPKVIRIVYRIAQVPEALFLSISGLSILGYSVFKLNNVQSVCAILTSVYYFFSLFRLFKNDELPVAFSVTSNKFVRSILMIPIALFSLTFVTKISVPLLLILGLAFSMIGLFAGIVRMFPKGENLFDEISLSVFPITIYYFFLGLALLTDFWLLNYLALIFGFLTSLVILGELFFRRSNT